ncbi:MAG TPA: hypothetical protein VHY91_03685 [Pirellulales bacterium]|jgi:hypothetical protein|nr:hypothetical protein [Pirellulales bacterium]
MNHRMRRVLREIGFAFLAWLTPFAVSVCIFPLKAANEPLFDSLMGVTLACSTVVLAVVYFQRPSAYYIADGVKIGIRWAVANWLLDALMFSGGPMKMSLGRYVSDIGIAYLAIPAITIGMGIAASRAARQRSGE